MLKEFLLYYLLVDFVVSFVVLALALFVLKRRKDYIRGRIINWLGLNGLINTTIPVRVEKKINSNRSSCRDSW